MISTMRAASAIDAIDRLVDLFPTAEQDQVRHSLVGVLRGVVNQRLLERVDGKGRVPATEVLVGTSKVLDAVAVLDRQAEFQRLLAEGQYHGMQTLDQGLLELVRDGMVSLRNGLGASAKPEDLRIAELGRADHRLLIRTDTSHGHGESLAALAAW